MFLTHIDAPFLNSFFQTLSSTRSQDITLIILFIIHYGYVLCIDYPATNIVYICALLCKLGFSKGGNMTSMRVIIPHPNYLF